MSSTRRSFLQACTLTALSPAAVAGQRVIRLGSQASDPLKDWLFCFRELNSGNADVLLIEGTHYLSRLQETDILSSVAVWKRGTVHFLPHSIVDFDYLGAPLLICTGEDAKVLSGSPSFRFSGRTPHTHDVKVSDVAALADFTDATSFGGDYEAWSMILSFGSKLKVERLNVSSVQRGADTPIIPFVINLKPLSVRRNASDISLNHLTLADFVHGILFSGQTGLSVFDVVALSRAGLPLVAPGHVLYATGIGSKVENRWCHVERIFDQGEYSPGSQDNSRALGVIAAKRIYNSVFRHVHSRSFYGVLQSLQDCHYCEFLYFTYNSARPDRKGPPTINIVGNVCSNVFRHWTVTMKKSLFSITSDRTGQFSSNRFSDFSIICDTTALDKANGLVDFRGSRNYLRIKLVAEPINATTIIVSLRGSDSLFNNIEVTYKKGRSAPRKADNGSFNKVSLMSF
jgi:hypothetical protein